MPLLVNKIIANSVPQLALKLTKQQTESRNQLSSHQSLKRSFPTSLPSFQKQKHENFKTKPDKGLINSRNEVTDDARGTYILFSEVQYPCRSIWCGGRIYMQYKSTLSSNSPSFLSAFLGLSSLALFISLLPLGHTLFEIIVPISCDPRVRADCCCFFVCRVVVIVVRSCCA